MTDKRKMTVKEFRELGYLQELNRLFLHPLGLALEVYVNRETGEERFGEVWDSRDDPEGFVYEPRRMIDPYKADRIDRERLEKALTRHRRFGWTIQPPPP